MNGLARCISLTCAAWLVFYVCWGSTTNGKDWFLQKVAAGDKAVVPIVTLCLPILVAGTSCAVLLLIWTNNNGSSMMFGIESGGGKRRPKKSEEHRIAASTLPHQLPSWIHRLYHRVCSIRRQGGGGRGRQSLRRFVPPCLRAGGAGDAQMGVIAVVFLVMPLVLFTIATIRRHVSGNEDMDYKVKEIGNAFGMAATIAMSYVLIPVSRHSPLLQQMTSWSPAHVIYLHHVAGRLVVVGGLLHGALHVYRWMAIQGHGFLEMISPPAQCWTIQNDNDDDDCYSKFRNLTGTLAGVALVVLALTTTFSFIRRRFYTLFWKSHVVSAPWLYIMVILHYEKAILYVAGGVLYYLATTMPVWLETRSSNNTMYTSFSSLCCSSSSSNQKEAFGVPIVAVQRIPSGSGGGHDVGADTTTATTTTACIMSVTIQVDPVALERFRAGQYVRLVAPEISILAHPFTINMCPLSILRRQQQQQQQQQHSGQDDENTTNESDDTNSAAAADGTGHYCCMQIIFRATGNFTKQLAQGLLNTNNATLSERPQPLPVSLRLDGFYGPPNRLRTALLEHDVILIVAGGIGITPYLSLLHQLHQNLVTSFRQDKLQQSLKVQGTAAAEASRHHHPFRIKRIVLHWMCRDAALIDYIKREYFAPLLLDDTSTNTSNDLSDDNDFGIQLVIHQTGISTRRLDTNTISTTALFSSPDTRNPRDDDIDQNRTREQEAQQEQERVILDRPVGAGVPFRPSKFAAGTKTSYLANAPLFLSFCLIGWIGLIIIWYCFTNFDSKNQVMPRSYSMVGVLILSLTVGAVLNRLFTPAWEDRREDSFYSAISTSAHNDDIDETVDHDEEDTTATVSMQGVEMAKANASTALHQTEQEGLRDYRTGSDGLLRGALVDSTLGDGSSGSALATLEERRGRPNVREFLHVFDSLRANHPAVYACGPNDLTRSIRVAVNERHCRVCFCKIAFYQERFEL